MAGKDKVGEGIDRHPGGIAETHVGHLRLLVVGDHPDPRQRHHRYHLGADIDELTGPDLTLAHQPVRRRDDAGIIHVVAGQGHLRLRRLDLGPKLVLLHVQTRQQSLLLIELSIVELELGSGAPFVGVRLLDQLLGSGDTGLQQFALTLRLQLITHQVGLGRHDGRLGLTDQCPLNVLLVREIGQRRLCGGEVGLGLRQLRAIVGGIDLHDQIALAHNLIVSDTDGGDIARDFRRQRGHVAGGVGVVGRLVTGGAGPAVPVSRHVPGQDTGPDHHQNPQHREDPGGSAPCRGARVRRCRCTVGCGRVFVRRRRPAGGWGHGRLAHGVGRVGHRRQVPDPVGEVAKGLLPVSPRVVGRRGPALAPACWAPGPPRQTLDHRRVDRNGRACGDAAISPGVSLVAASHARPEPDAGSESEPEPYPPNFGARGNPFGGRRPAVARSPSHGRRSVSVRTRSPSRHVRPSARRKIFASDSPPSL